MSEIQQQIADGARPLARVGDVIEHGQDVPANVRELSDSSSTNGWGRWVRSINGLWNWAPTADDVESAELRVGGCREHEMTDPDSTCAPYRVEAVSYNRPPVGFEVDPEPQPDREAVDADGFCVPPCTVCGTVPAESGPLVLTLPQVPAEAVALVGNLSGRRWTRYEGLRSDGIEWQYRPTDVPWSLASILNDERPDGVTVEFAPPREPRTWPKIAVEAEDPDVVDVYSSWPSGEHRWLRHSGSAFYYCGCGGCADRTLAGLRELGEVREVLDDGQ